MKFSNLLQTTKESFKSFGKFFKFKKQIESKEVEESNFDLREVVGRFEKIQAPEIPEQTQIGKLIPKSVPQEVLVENQIIYILAWIQTAGLFWLAFYIPKDWLLWYGFIAILIFALVFRLEGPKSRKEKLIRHLEVHKTKENYLKAQENLKNILGNSFQERMEEFEELKESYEETYSEMENFINSNKNIDSKNCQQELTQKMSQIEKRLTNLVNELEDFSDIHKDKINLAIKERYKTRLDYYQARLNEIEISGIIEN